MLRFRKILLCNYFYYCILFFSLLITTIRIVIPKTSTLSEKDTTFQGIVTNIVEQENRITIYLTNKETVIANYDGKEKLSIRLGDVIEVQGDFYRPSRNTTKYLFNYQEYCYRKNIFFIINIRNYQIIKRNHNFYYFIKQKLKNRVKNNAYLNTFILGDKSSILPEVKRSYQENGISHLFAISGMHITLLSKILEKLLLKLKCFKETIFKITSLFLISYLFLVGFSPSILRGVLFYFLFFLNDFYYFYISKNHLFILILSFALLINPNYLFDIGFLYSYWISFCLLNQTDFFSTKSSFLSFFQVSLLSFIVSIPITLYSYQQINLLSLLYNAFFVPFISFFVYPLTLLVFVLKPLEFIYNGIILLMENVSVFCYSISFGKFIFKRLPFGIYILYLFILFLFIMRKKKRYLIIFLFLIVLHFSIPFFDSHDYVEMIDVGQGDSILIHLHNKNILIDTGGKYQRGNVFYHILLPTFKTSGISKIDYLILSHGDKDHMGDAIDLVQNYRVGEVFFNCGEYNYLEKELIRILEKKHIKYESCISELELKNTILYFLQTKDFLDENDNSNVIYMEINNFKFMFMGDASMKTEKEVLNTYQLPEIDVLKVGHHGSKTSSGMEFINTIRPKYALISAGKDNKFNHPNEGVLNNLKDSRIYRTDQDGSIMFKIKNNQLKIETHNP